MTIYNGLTRIIFVASLAFLVVAPSGCSVFEQGDTPNSRSTERSDSDAEGDYPKAPKALAEAELKTLDGGTVKIGDLKGKVVLINLWATWCAPCIEEMPHFVRLQDKYREDGFVVLGLNSDEEGEEEVRRFVEEQGLNYTIGWADQAVAEEFMKISKLPGIPQSLLLNRNGEMTGMFRGGGKKVIDKMVESVEKLMNEPEMKAD